MKIGFIGLGRMGNAMVLHALEQGIDVVAYNRSKEKVDAVLLESRTLKKGKITAGKLSPSYSIEELVQKLEKPAVIILMVPQGAPVDEMIEKLLAAGVTAGDTIIDGGNCFYKHSQRHFTELKKESINYLDMGTSGGLEGARNGACLMIGGDEEVFKKLEPLFAKMACKNGYAYFGPSGAGHFVKMVHNGVEYGMLQALGEGFDILNSGPFQLDFQKISKNWIHGSVVRGWLVELLEKAFREDPKLEKLEGVVGGGTTGTWTIETAREFNVATPVLYESLRARETSQVKPTFAGKVVAALRNQFGGHAVKNSQSKEI